MAKIHTLNDSMTAVEIMPPSESNEHEFKTKQDQDFCLRFELRYVLRIMGVFGLYHTPEGWLKCEKTFGRYLHQAHRFYCFGVQLFLFVTGIKSAIGLWFIDSEFIAIDLTVTVWWFECAINTCVLYYLYSSEKVPNVLNLWQNTCQSSAHSRLFGTNLDVKFVRRQLFLLFGVAIVFSLVNMLFMVLARFGPFENEIVRNDTMWMITPYTEPIIVWDLAFLFAFLYGSAAFFFPIALVVLICSIISLQFTQFTDTFKSCVIKEQGAKFTKCIMALRRQHQCLSKVVSDLDDALSFYLAVTIGIMIILACLQLYQFTIVGLTSFTGIVTALFWFICVTVLFIGLSTSTAQVHHKAHEIVNFIHEIGTFDFTSHEQVAQMNVFLAKLNGPPIALTLWGIVPLTKEFILTVVGIFITYFALVVQTF